MFKALGIDAWMMATYIAAMTNPIEILKQLGMRQAEIARELGVTPGHVQRMGCGERQLSKIHLATLRTLIAARASSLKKLLKQVDRND